MKDSFQQSIHNANASFFGFMREAPISLSSPCAACGQFVGGGFEYCPKCKIALCFYCQMMLFLSQKNPRPKARCPMCGEYFPDY
jgi:hypothetical protein